jgi:hypothetical protein
MSPTPEQLNAVADWLETQAIEVELCDVRAALRRELEQLAREYPALAKVVDEAKAAGCVDDEAQCRFWRAVSEAVGNDLERRKRISEMLYALIQANRAVKAKHANGARRTQA